MSKTNTWRYKNFNLFLKWLVHHGIHKGLSIKRNVETNVVILSYQKPFMNEFIEIKYGDTLTFTKTSPATWRLRNRNNTNGEVTGIIEGEFPIKKDISLDREPVRIKVEDNE